MTDTELKNKISETAEKMKEYPEEKRSLVFQRVKRQFRYDIARYVINQLDCRLHTQGDLFKK